MQKATEHLLKLGRNAKDENMTIQEASDKLSKELNRPPWLAAVGHGANCIYVYVKRKLAGYENALLPKEYNGFKVIVKVNGPMSAQGAK
jgi:hypothetical protein